MSLIQVPVPDLGDIEDAAIIEILVKPGDTVKWTNMEKRTSHSVLFPAENGLESDRLFPGESWQRTFGAAGSYAYRCGPHEEMKGVVRVE